MMRTSSGLRRMRMKRKLYILLAVTALFLLAAAFAEKLCPYDPYAQSFPVLAPPDFLHPAGTDRLGRDMLSRMMIGVQTGVFASLAAAAAVTVTGTCIGFLCAEKGGTAEAVLMRAADVCLAFPGMVLALAVAAVLGGGLENAVIALAAAGWPKYARLARSLALAQKNTDYAAAARLAGDTPVQLVIRHILPNCAGPLLVTAVLDIGTIMTELAGLSFLGLGAAPPVPELGSMMNGGRSLLQICPWVILGPGLAVFLPVVLFNLLGDAVRDVLDPRGGQGTGRRIP